MKGREAAEARKAAKTLKVDIDLKAKLSTAMSHTGGFGAYMDEVLVTWL